MNEAVLDFYFVTYRKDSLVMQGLAYANEVIKLIDNDTNINLVPVYIKSLNDRIIIPEPSSKKITVMLNPKVGKMPDYSNKWLNEFNNDIDELDELLNDHLGELNYVNSPESVKLLRNKVAMSKAIDSFVMHPKLYENLNVKEVIELLTEGNPLCIKPIAGTEGSGVTKIKYSKEGLFNVHTMYDKETISNKGKKLTSKNNPTFITLKDPITRKFVKKLLNYGVIIQDWIEPKRICYEDLLRIYDYRVLGVYPKYVNGITSELWRISLNDLVTNLSAEGNQRSTYYQMAKLVGSDKIKEARKVGLKVFKKFPGLNIAAVDLLQSEKGWTVIELNAFPDIGTERYGVPRYPFILLGALKDHGLTLSEPLEKMLKLTFPETAQRIVERLMH